MVRVDWRKSRNFTGAAFARLILLALLALSGVAAGATISVVVPDVQEPGRAYYTDVLVPAFERETGIKVELDLRGWGGYMDHLVTLFAAGEAPDVIQIGGEALGTFVRNGLVQPLGEWVNRWGSLDDFARAAILDGTVDGKLYTIPYRLDQRPLLYRIDFFEEAGLDGSRPPVTWEELRDAALKLVRADVDGQIQRAGLNTGPAGDLAAIFIYQNGGRLVTQDGKRAAFDSREAIDAIQFLVDLVNVYRVGLPTGSPWEGADPIVTGRARDGVHGDWTLGQMAQVHPDSTGALGVAIPPGRVSRSGFLYVNKWAITSASKNPDAAWKWIEYVSRPEVMYELSPRQLVPAAEAGGAARAAFLRRSALARLSPGRRGDGASSRKHLQPRRGVVTPVPRCRWRAQTGRERGGRTEERGPAGDDRHLGSITQSAAHGVLRPGRPALRSERGSIVYLRSGALTPDRRLFRIRGGIHR